MQIYKCIYCGKEKESKNFCSCPECGYRMFPYPYIRSDLLKEEIKRFLLSFIPQNIYYEDFEIYRTEFTQKSQSELDKNVYIPKEEDDNRFPSFETIQNYVSNAPRTEEFYNRIITAIQEIKKHYSTRCEMNYKVSFSRLSEKHNKNLEILKKALFTMGISMDIPETFIPEFSLYYAETPDREFSYLLDEFSEKASELAKKIKTFIKQNNMYGTSYRYTPVRKYPQSDDWFETLEKHVDSISNVIAKKYTVDIMDDGNKELCEMLDALWGALEAVKSAPILRKQYIYTLPDDSTYINDGIKKGVFNIISPWYSSIEALVSNGDFLSYKTEEELLDIYNQMIDLDVFGFLGINKNNLIKIGESEKKLNELIGLEEIKNSIMKIKAYAISNKNADTLNIHMCFLGNPGTGKTEVARLIADIFYENKILPTNNFIEVDRSGLVSEYYGATAEKTRKVIERAMGGVLFIDEAYALGNNAESPTTDYGREAIDTLVKAMEDYRGKFCVIFAGYKNEMLKMMSINPGFRSRIQFILDFPNYSQEELSRIANLMITKQGYSISDNALNIILDIADVKRKEINFANAREIRNILDKVIMNQNLRCLDGTDKEIGIVDVNTFIADDKIQLVTSNNDQKTLTPDEELDRLIGLESVKRVIKKIKAYAKRNKGTDDFSIHMCFSGNPGTGKTEVARILSRILYDAGVLNEAKLVEIDGQGLIGSFEGETTAKTLKKIDEASNSVLFIDEAYSLTDGKLNKSSGSEAVAILLKAMEDRRGQFCVILAGYKNEMAEMLKSNPGFDSRIQFKIDFPDYSREELKEISKSFALKKKYIISSPALEKILDIAEYYRNKPNFANARTIRNIIEQVIMNQNLRTEEFPDDNEIVIEDVLDYLIDEGISLG